MTLRPSHRFAITFAWAMTMASATLLGQDSLSRAKDFYQSAAYEEALAVLDKLHGSTPAINSTEVSAYQVFCLVALGRSDDATKAIETMVKSDPLFHPSDAQASPRVRAFFENVRRPLLPDIVRDSYAKGKDAFARKDMAAATAEFDQVIALIDEMGAGADPGLADLRTLASGFRDLSKVPEPTPTPTPTPTPNTDRRRGATGPQRTDRDGHGSARGRLARARPQPGLHGLGPRRHETGGRLEGDADVEPGQSGRQAARLPRHARALD